MDNFTKDVRKLTIEISGMHCPNCEHVIERRIGKLPGVIEVLASEQKRGAEIFYLGDLDFSLVRRTLEEEGYGASPPSGAGSAAAFESNTREYAEIVAWFVILAAIAVAVQRLGLVPPQGFSISENTGYGLAFLIGLAASVTSCMAVTGGLLVALAAKYSEVNPGRSAWQRFRPHLSFNAGRLVSYALLGGAVGALGSALTPSPAVTSALIVAASAVMVLLGLQMLCLLPSFGSYARLPKRFAHRVHDFAEHNSGSGAFALGALTFFLPCGFTQAVQLYVLAKGSFTVGALTMLAFALGTLPALLSLSALSSFARGAFQKHFLRFAGVAVILLGVLNIQYGFVLAGSNLSPAPAPESASQTVAPVVNGKQVVQMKIDGYDYIPNRFSVRQGVPVEWRIDARNAAGCGRILLSRSMGIEKFLSASEVNVVSFTPKAPGRYSFNCGMGMMTPNSHFMVTGDPADLPQGVEKL